jgi:hypothetical protein
MKLTFKFTFILLLLTATNALAQNQKVWTGSSKLFGIDSTANRGSNVNWNLGLGTGSTSTKTDSNVVSVANRTIFTRANFINTTSAMVVDTIKVTETLNSCITTTGIKLIEVFPLPTFNLASNQTLCAGSSPSNFNLVISNYAAINSIGNFSISYELRAGSTIGTPLGGASSGNLTGINSNTIPINVSSWPALTANTTYYFIITAFGSEITSPIPVPGNIGPSGLASFPQTYTITVQPSLTNPSIISY